MSSTIKSRGERATTLNCVFSTEWCSHPSCHWLLFRGCILQPTFCISAFLDVAWEYSCQFWWQEEDSLWSYQGSQNWIGLKSPSRWPWQPPWFSGSINSSREIQWHLFSLRLSTAKIHSTLNQRPPPYFLPFEALPSSLAFHSTLHSIQAKSSKKLIFPAHAKNIKFLYFQWANARCSLQLDIDGNNNDRTVARHFKYAKELQNRRVLQLHIRRVCILSISIHISHSQAVHEQIACKNQGELRGDFYCWVTRTLHTALHWMKIQCEKLFVKIEGR